MHGAIHLFERLPQVELDANAVKPRALAPARSEPLVGLIRNPRSHRNENGTDEPEDLPGVIAATPHKRKELHNILADFAAKGVDYIAIDGGDGTVRDVLTCGAGAFGESWPALIVLPSGKTNALAHDLGIPGEWTLAQAVAAAKRDSVATRRPLVIAQRDNNRAQVRGFVLGAGAYTAAIDLGQEAHSYGAFNALGVGVTIAWSLLQALFGRDSNGWRRGTKMRLRDPDGRELEHVGGTPADERYLLFVSSLGKFPAGLALFKGLAGPLRLAVFDSSRRSLLLRLPAILRGRVSDAARRRGFRMHALERFEFDIRDRFILDGEAFPPGSYVVTAGPRLRFIVP